MQVLVVGGAGYVGSHAVRSLIQAGYEVVVLDNLVTGYREAVYPDAHFVEGDLRNSEILDDIFTQYHIEGVFHFAAYSLVGESVHKPIDYFDNNVAGMISLIEAMKKYQVNKLIFSSTAAVYGEVNVPLIDEMTPAHPTSPYGQSKLMMEQIMSWCTQAYDLKYVSLRYFNVAGATQSGEIGEAHNPETHLIPIVLQVALGQREQLNIFGNDYPTPDGTNIRDYIHVDDLIDAHILAFKYLIQGGKSNIFNLGSANGYSVLEILEAARRVTGHEIPAKVTERRKGDPSILVASSFKAQKELGWQPQYDNIEKIIETAWNWHQAHPNGYVS